MSTVSSANLMTMKNFTSYLNQNTPPSCASCHDKRLNNLLTTHLDASRAHAETKQLSDYHINCKQCIRSSVDKTLSTEEKTGNVFFTCKQCNEVFETSYTTFSEMTANPVDMKTSTPSHYSIDDCSFATRSFINAYNKGAPVHFDNFFM
jgi:hypothetical protein